jgi:hypothetical protein
MVIEATKLTILDPTVEAMADHTNMAPRPADLDGLMVGLLANGKRNSDKLLEAVYTLLDERYELQGAVRVNKGDASRPAPTPVVDELLRKCDLVITATGD